MAVASFRYRIEMVEKLHLNWAERHACRSGSGECYLSTAVTMPHTSAEIPPAGAPSGFDGTPQAFALK